MTRNSCVSERICGSHICSLQPSEFDRIKVGPLSRPSTDTLSRHPSASIIGICVPLSCADKAPFNKMDCRVKPAMTSELFVVERGKQPVDQRLRGALIGHRLEQSGKF